MITVSHSDIASFLRCRRQFTLGYVHDFREPEKAWGALACGSRVHKAVDISHKTGEPARDVHQRLAEEDESAITISGAPGWALGEFYDDVIVGRNCCTAYTEWIEREGPYDGYKIYSESVLRAPILDGRAMLIGKADLLLEREDDGWLFIDDLKTASPHTRTSLPVQLERSYQHDVYRLLASKVFPDQQVGGGAYTILYKVKNPARAKHPMVEQFHPPSAASRMPRRSLQIEQIVSDMLDLMERLETQGPQVAYPTPGDSCRWCAFRLPCLLADENPLGARAMLDGEFVRGGRHGRYDDLL